MTAVSGSHNGLSPEHFALASDEGAETQDRYSWQHHCTAADALRMLNDESIKRVICEIGEDYLIEYVDGRLELVSCKHREPGKGEWKLSDLCRTGGIGHLFATWHKAQPKPYRLRLLTNAGLRSGVGEASVTAEACAHLADGGSVEQVGSACRALAIELLAARRVKNFDGIPLTEKPKRKSDAVIPDGFQDAVVEFMSVLVIRPGLPHRMLIRDHSIQARMRPILAAVGLSDVYADEQYEATLAVVAEKNHSNAVAGRISDWMTSAEPPSGDRRALINARSILPGTVRTCVESVGSRGMLRRWETSGHDRLRAKLIEGGVKQTRVNSALRLREAWLAAWAEMRTGLPGDIEARDDLEARVLELAGDAESAVASSGEWGNAMYERLKGSLSSEFESLGLGFRLEPKLLMGVALDLAAQCDVWFSEPFDVDAALKAVAVAEEQAG